MAKYMNRGGKVHEHRISLAASWIEGKPEMGEKCQEQRGEEEGGCHPKAGGC